MQIEEYQALAMRTSPEGHDRVLNGCLGLIGESGEVVDAVKKWRFQSGEGAEIPRDKLIDELGDVLWYCAELATGLEKRLDDLYACTAAGIDGSGVGPSRDELIIKSAANLATMATRPYRDLFTGGKVKKKHWREAEACDALIDIMTIVRVMMKLLYCDGTLELAMQRNIDKLKKRYPDGFDPERSLHRSV